MSANTTAVLAQKSQGQESKEMSIVCTFRGVCTCNCFYFLFLYSQLYCLPIQQQSHLQNKGKRARKSTYVPIVSSPITKIRKAKSLTNCQFSSTISQCELLASELFLTLCRRIYR